VSKLSNGSLLLIGDGPNKKKLEKLGKKKLRGRFKILRVEYKNIAKYYRACDVFSLPVWEREAWGLVFLEAMACGLAVVAPNDEIRKEIVGNAGFLVNVEDSNCYAKYLEKASRLNWKDRPRKQAEKFSWEKIAKEYDKVLSNLIK